MYNSYIHIYMKLSKYHTSILNNDGMKKQKYYPFPFNRYALSNSFVQGTIPDSEGSHFL